MLVKAVILWTVLLLFKDCDSNLKILYKVWNAGTEFWSYAEKLIWGNKAGANRDFVLFTDAGMRRGRKTGGLMPEVKPFLAALQKFVCIHWL